MSSILTAILSFSFAWVGGGALCLSGAIHAYYGSQRNARILLVVGLLTTVGAIVLHICEL